MVEVGDAAPDFTVPMADGDVGSFTLSEHLEEAPLVLAFCPAAFTNTCTAEMCSFRDRLANFEDVGGSVYGISVDLPYTLNEFRRQNGLSFPLLSDANREVIEAFDIKRDFKGLGIDVAKRAVFVIDGEGTVVYRWVSEELKVEPDYEAVERAVDGVATPAADD